MMVVGFLTEFVADQQKFSYRNDTNNKNKWCDIGVWKYSRHPNYFGELLFWWGVFTASSPVLLASQNGWGYFTVLSPLFMCFVLLGLSGMPILEPSMHKRWVVASWILCGFVRILCYAHSVPAGFVLTGTATTRRIAGISTRLASLFPFPTVRAARFRCGTRCAM